MSKFRLTAAALLATVCGAQAGDLKRPTWDCYQVYDIKGEDFFIDRFYSEHKSYAAAKKVCGREGMYMQLPSGRYEFFDKATRELKEPKHPENELPYKTCAIAENCLGSDGKWRSNHDGKTSN